MRENSATSIPDLEARIAARVRSRRAELGMSLEALAQRSGVSRSMLSVVERAESSPTAVLLERIATGLSLPLAQLFDDPSPAAGPVARHQDHVPWKDPQSGYVRRNLSPAGFASPIHLVDVVMPPGASVAYETGTRDVGVHQQIWVQSGRLEVTVGSVTHQLGTDDCLAMELNQPTAFRNRTRRPARYLVALAPDRLGGSGR